MFCLLFLLVSVNSLRVSELSAIQRDISNLFQTFRAPSGFFFPATAFRLGFHDAGTWSNAAKNGGPHATQALNCERGQSVCEKTLGDNVGLPWAVAALETVYKKYTNVCSRADFWQISANVAIKVTGGPDIPFRWGRLDAQSALQSVTNRLPSPELDLDGIRSFMGPNRLGLSDREIVALLGAHTLGCAHPDASGHRFCWDTTPTKFDNDYYISLMANDWAFNRQTSQWEAQRNIGGRLVNNLMLDADFALKRDLRNLNVKSTTFPIVNFYAQNAGQWRADFVAVWQKIQELGTNGALRAVCKDNADDCDFNPALKLALAAKPPTQAGGVAQRPVPPPVRQQQQQIFIFWSFRKEDDGTTHLEVQPWGWVLIAFGAFVFVAIVILALLGIQRYRRSHAQETV